MKLSVIIPAYNIAEYIGDCLESIINQTYRDLEIIVVNDGSTDHTREIIRRYEADDRVIVIDKSNGGLSDARNVGIERATGGLITFVDGDDLVSIDAYEKNIAVFLEDSDLDMVQYPVLFNWQSDHEYPFSPKNETLNGDEIFSSWWNNDQLIYSAWNKIYKKKLFDSIRYPKGRCFEDMYIVPDLSKVIRKAMISENGIYYYRFREGSILNSRISFQKHMDQLVAMLRIDRESSYYSALKRERAQFWIEIFWWQLYSIHHFDKSEQSTIIEYLRNFPLPFSCFLIGNLTLKYRIRILTIYLLGFQTTFHLYTTYRNILNRLKL